MQRCTVSTLGSTTSKIKLHAKISAQRILSMGIVSLISDHRKRCQVCDFPTEMVPVLLNSHSQIDTKAALSLMIVKLHEKHGSSVFNSLARSHQKVTRLNRRNARGLFNTSLTAQLKAWVRLRLTFKVLYRPCCVGLDTELGFSRLYLADI